MPLTRQQKKDLNITDLKAYTMASEEAIDAKLKAFENRMEEKMRSLFAEFSRPTIKPEEVTPWYFYRGPKAGDPRRSKGAATVHSYGGDFLYAYPRRTNEPRGMQDKGRSPTSHAEAYYPLYCIQAPAPKKLTRDELRERSTKELCWHCNEPWSRKHHYKKGQLLVIEPMEDKDNETSEKALEPKEKAIEEESPPANYAVHALAGYSNPQMMKVGGLLK
ncbi:hypothetical protein BHM03_00015305 [Ensete ventricosum]|nr:hypothetical protein BHM03_00015305 [Ensete ventricosum]